MSHSMPYQRISDKGMEVGLRDLIEPMSLNVMKARTAEEDMWWPVTYHRVTSEGI